ncbi:hypothetical protein [Evansella cellulosilytica]|uniref:Uncharacterized protein n=1 Tax=Evansella cellulosilytica (strain ATCC 21833 / DSM 2522 / FERM P-1141 / JCM 9156 / N-4) TaxID=649639 RepID=E6TZH2_EVAC2|nr:hypothetical protein [Evansella cellulosilytica]ADU30146.1 hypothetical protein Bcell_1884 [Evansella cellulosilytica DSM 2522]
MKYVINVIDDDTRKVKDIWVEDGKVRYTDLPAERSGIYQVASTDFQVLPGKITFDDQVVPAYRLGNGLSYVKRLLLFGNTTFIHPIKVEYESELHHKLSDVRQTLLSCPIDYLFAIVVPATKLSDTFVRKLKYESIAIVFVEVNNTSELDEVPWQRVAEAIFPKRILIVCKPSDMALIKKYDANIMEKWKKIVKRYKFNSYFNFPTLGKSVSLFLSKRIGLYPQKGALVMGSDADYVMYHELENDTPIKFPDIIVLKGQVIKAALQWTIEDIEGAELTSLVPEKFLPIQDVYRFEDINKDI